MEDQKKTYDLIAVGTGSAMNIVEGVLQYDPDKRIAVVDKDDPGGICLTRGCIPSKLLIYPAELVRMIERSTQLGVHTEIQEVNFPEIMDRMQTILQRDVDGIRESLSNSPDVDYYHSVAEFVGPHQLSVGDEILTARTILLGLGSRPLIPPIPGLEEAGYLTSDTVLDLRELPGRLAILGGGYIAAEYGHFFSAMGSKVTIVGRNPQFLPMEEPEVAELVKRALSDHLTLVTAHEVIDIQPAGSGGKRIVARHTETGKEMQLVADEILVAVGRASNADLLHPERSGIEVDDGGWIQVDEHLQTSQPGIWAFGDATGRHQFKHVANYESRIVYYNAVLGEPVKADYTGVPHAVFCHPEVASIGLGQREAVETFGEDVMVGFCRYQDTARGEAMGITGCFAKVIVAADTREILGCHIVGPQASVLIQEIITLCYSRDRTVDPILQGMHIHPALSEVVERAVTSLVPVDHYNHLLAEGIL